MGWKFRKSTAKGAQPGQLAIVIPTFNSADYIDIILQYYAEHAIDVQVFVDEKSTDDTREIVSRAGFAPRSFGGIHVIEQAIEKLARASNAEWVLRLDDDELPSLSMIERARAIAAFDEPVARACSFARWQCAVGQDGRLIRNLAHSPFDHRQWRLFDTRDVDFLTDIHTPGINPGTAPAEAHSPLSAAMIHLDWTVHSRESRMEKVERYDGIKPGAGSQWRSYYLIEEDEVAQRYFEPFPMAEFAATARSLHARFPDRAWPVL